MDNAFSLNVKLPAPAFLVNVFRCLLLVYCSDCRVVFFSLERTDDDPSKKAVKVLLFVRLKPFYVSEYFFVRDEWFIHPTCIMEVDILRLT